MYESVPSPLLHDMIYKWPIIDCDHNNKDDNEYNYEYDGDDYDDDDCNDDDDF